MCFSDWSFAVYGDAEEVWTLAWTLDFIISCLSRFWVIFANIAWKFLSNNWVYGEVLWIDVLLWKYRNIVKNMANFCLWFYLVYVIFKWLIGQWKENIMDNLKSVLLRILVAWIWVQASWFLTSVVIDLSTITMSAVWALPSQVLSQNSYLKEWIDVSMRDFTEGNKDVVKGRLFSLFSEDATANTFTKWTNISLEKPITQTWFVDSLMPNKDDISGPLYYMWFAILRTQELNSVSSYTKASVKKSILNLIIQWWTTIVYSIELGVLCVIALMRILYLWMFIVLSPFAILLACIEKAWEKDLLKKWFISDLMKQINLKTFFAKTFQPAIIVLWISLCMIFVTLISRVVNLDTKKSMQNFNIWWAVISSLQDEKYATTDDTTYTTSLDWKMIKISLSTVWKWILDFMMSIITVVLVYMIINMSIKIWNKLWGWQDFLSKRIDSVQKWIEWVMTSVPIVPVAWYDKDGVPTTHHMSAGQVLGLWGKSSLIGKWVEKIQGAVDKRYEDQSQIINKWFGDSTWYLTLHEQNKITNARTGTSVGIWQLGAMNNAIEKSEDWKWMTLNPEIASNQGFWIQEFTKWLDWMNGKTVTWTNYNSEWNEMITRWNDSGNTDKTLEKMFKSYGKENQHVKAYADLFGLNLSSNTWDQLKNADISKK